MKKIILAFSILVLLSSNISYASEATGNLSTGISTDGGLNFQLPCSPSSVSNGTVNSATCAITCNSGYNLSGTSCVAQSTGLGGGGGGGGGVPSVCLDSQLECKDSAKGYVLFRKTGISCNGGNLGKTCSLDDTTGTGSTDETGTGSSQEQTGTGETQGSDNQKDSQTPSIENKQEFKSTVSDIDFGKKDEKIELLLATFFDKIIDLKDFDYLALFDDEVKAKLESIYENMYSFSVNLGKYINGDKTVVSLINKAYKNILSLKESLATLKVNYVTKSNNKYTENVYIYKFVSTNSSLNKSFDKFEKSFVGGVSELYKQGKLSKEIYLEKVANYNDFVFKFAVYYKYKTAESKQELVTALQKLK